MGSASVWPVGHIFFHMYILMPATSGASFCFKGCVIKKHLAPREDRVYRYERDLTDKPPTQLVVCTH